MKIKAIEFIRGALGMTANVTLIKDNEIIYQGLRSMIPFQQIADCEVESIAGPGAEGDIIVSLNTSKSTTYRITYLLDAMRVLTSSPHHTASMQHAQSFRPFRAYR